MKRNDSHDQFEDALQFAASAHGDELIPRAARSLMLRTFSWCSRNFGIIDPG